MTFRQDTNTALLQFLSLKCFSACWWFVDLASRLLLLRSQAWCLSPVWFGSQPQSAGHRFLLKATKPVIWPRRDDDLDISERILTSQLESLNKWVISQDRSSFGFDPPTANPTANGPFFSSSTLIFYLGEFCVAVIVAFSDFSQLQSTPVNSSQLELAGSKLY